LANQSRRKHIPVSVRYFLSVRGDSKDDGKTHVDVRSEF
jgi:hypothetical protein